MIYTARVYIILLFLTEVGLAWLNLRSAAKMSVETERSVAHLIQAHVNVAMQSSGL